MWEEEPPPPWFLQGRDRGPTILSFCPWLSIEGRGGSFLGHQVYWRRFWGVGGREDPSLEGNHRLSAEWKAEICSTLKNTTEYFMRSPGCGNCFL